MPQDTLTCQKAAFSLPEDLHYLNCAYMSPLAKTVEAAGLRGMQAKRNPASIGPADFFEDGERVRTAFAQLVGAASDDIALLGSASYGLALVAKNTPMDAAQNIVVLHEQFPSNVYTWQRLQLTHGVAIRTVLPPDHGPARGRRWNERLLDTIDAQTALVAVPHVHWADGTWFDLAALGARCREVGAAFVVDGTQSVGALPFDVQELQPDALICASYKWLMGPYSFGLGYFGPRYADGIPLEENWINRLGSEQFSGLVDYQRHYQPGMRRYDIGERSNFILLPMVAAGLDLVLGWQPARIQHYCAALTADVLAEAQALGFQIGEPDERASHLFGLRVPPALPLSRLQEALAAHRVSASVRGNAIRLAPHVYNDAADLDALRAALHDCIRAVSA